MKIALQLSGQPRGYKVAIEYLKRNLFDLFDVDVYFHTWNNDVYPIEHIVDAYSPKAYAVDEPFPDFVTTTWNEEYSNTPNATKWPPSATISAFYSMYQTNLLRHRTGIHYDFVMRTRFDFALNLPATRLMEARRDFGIPKNGSFLMVPDDRGYSRPFFCNDQWSFGTLDFTTFYCETWRNVSDFYKSGVEMIGEEMLSANLQKYQIQPYLINLNHPFFPGQYNGSRHSLVRDDMTLWKK